MEKLNQHWTAKNLDNFVFRVASDFSVQLQKRLSALPMSQDQFAKALGLTEGRVSQLLHAPSNPRLATLVKCAHAAGLKVAIVAYDDGDPDNNWGPINSEIFATCWQNAGAPRDFFELRTCIHTQQRFFLELADNTTVRRKSDFGEYMPVGPELSVPNC